MRFFLPAKLLQTQQYNAAKQILKQSVNKFY